jgi:hypothetical protein
MTYTEGQPNWEDWLLLNRVKGLATPGMAAKGLLHERLELLESGWQFDDVAMLKRFTAILGLKAERLQRLDAFLVTLGAEPGESRPKRKRGTNG